MRYAEVALNVPVRKTFTYHIPAELAGSLRPGALVRVQFGVAMQPGLLLSLKSETDIPSTKPIIEALDAQPVLAPEYLALAKWLSESYLAPIGACVWLLLPPGFTGKSAKLYRFLRDDLSAAQPQQLSLPGAAPKAAPLSQRLLHYLRDKGPKRLTQLKSAFPKQPLETALDKLAAADMVAVEAALAPPAARRKTVKRVYAKFAPAELTAPTAQLPKTSKQRALLEALAAHRENGLSIPEALERAGAKSRAPLKALLEKGWLELREQQVWRDSLRDMDFVPSQAPKLTPGQQRVWQAIRPTLADAAPARFLLHGVTGSGKTEIYLRAIAETLAQGRSAILLVPEIALTPQTIRRVSERFPEQVAIVHGSLPMGERYDTWQRARQGAVSVIVGTRSALFTPLPNLGLIVLDEEHDISYKQAPWMSEPHYHARDVADWLTQRGGGTLILGSATPDLGTWRRARRGHYRRLHLPQRIMGHRQRIQQQAKRLGRAAQYQDQNADALTIELPPVTVVDMRAELRQGNTSMFSAALQSALSATLERGEQAMLLLNRRGQASYVFCRDCGSVLECARCDSPLTYHRIGQRLRCHHCGASEPQPQSCPACGSARIRYFGAGTQQVAEALQALLPAVRSLRWDIDSAKSPQMHFDILARFSRREADALIGTQMIAKGLDLPLVTLVGVVSADMGLALPDYRAGERVFQLLTQVAGRAGRGVLGGQVILQTYQPEHYVIQAAAQHDYVGFASRESRYRKELGYPPYRQLARIVFSYSDALRARQAAEGAARRLRQILAERNMTGSSLIGPVPCFYSRIDRRYRWQVLLRGPEPRAALQALTPEPGWQIDIDPVDVL